MGLQWILISSFLYLEIAIVLLLVLPIASPKKWNALFKSKFLLGLQKQAGVYFIVLLAILVLLLLDAIREMRKYTSAEVTEHKHLDHEMQNNMRLFRAQRNFYISGFSLFLSLVIRRLVLLISSQANLLAQSEASMKQAKSATAAARNLLEHQEEVKENVNNESAGKEVLQLKSKIEELEEQLEKEQKDKKAIKSQADNLAKEYDRLAEEHSKLQKREILQGTGDKKAD